MKDTTESDEDLPALGVCPQPNGCPHCGSVAGVWFDRSAALDAEGNEIPEESFPYRCCACGKNVDAPPGYYK